MAACFQIIAHAFTKPMIFVGAGAMIRASGKGHYWSNLRGAGWLDPVAGIAFTVGGLSLCGLPLLAGFSAKYGLAMAALAADWKTLPALFGLAASSVLNAMYYIPAILAIWGKRGEVAEAPGGRREHRFALVCFLVFNVILGVFVGPVMDVIHLGLGLL